MSRFSIIIPVYNKEAYIERTLKSVFSQTFSDFEVIIINDGSTDKSENKILNFKDARVKYFKQPNQGAAAARNAAIAKASNPYIALLDADDYWYPDFLSVINEMIGSYPSEKVFATAAAIETSGKIIEPTYSIEGLKKGAINTVNFFKASCIHSILTSSSTVIHKEAFKTTGYYKPSQIGGEDTDFWIRLGLNFPVVFLNNIHAVYHYVPESLSKQNLSIAERATFEGYENFEETRPEVKKFLDINRFSMAISAKIKGDKKAFLHFSKALNEKNLTKKQRFLLHLNRYLLQKLYRLKHYFERQGFYLSAYK